MAHEAVGEEAGGTRRRGRSRTGTMLSAEEMSAIDQALGKKGTVVADRAVYTVPLPRNDLKVTIKGLAVPFPFGFGGWIAFKKALDGQTVFMSDTVFLQAEINLVTSAAQANGIEVTAIHNHFFHKEPRIFYMHLHGHGETAQLPQSYANAIRPSPLLPANQPPPAASSAPGAAERVDLARLAAIAGHEGQANGPVYKITVGRSDLKVTAMGTEITAAMGLNSWAAFAGDRERAHCLRHSHATQLLEQGLHHKEVGERLGHTDAGTTMRMYVHVTPGRRTLAADLIDAALS